MSVPPVTLRPVRRQEWRSHPPPKLGSWEPQRSLTVVLPAKDCQQELTLTLAALAEQTYPSDLFDVIVVDDDSAVPLELPDARPSRTEILRLQPGTGHGSGRARHAGALASTGELLLFLDADMVATRHHLEAHARWHHTIADAVVLGRKYFVDFDGITAAAVGSAVRDERLDLLLQRRQRERHRWWEQFVTASKSLTAWAPDTFIAVVGASVSTPRGLYQESGGFSSMGLRGIVDTEFGYRIFTAGGVVVPEMESGAFHQGARNFALRGDQIKRERLGLAANYLPIPLFRPANMGRAWAVPGVRVIVDARPGTEEDVLVTVDSVLASSFTDCAVIVASDPAKPPQPWLADYYAHDYRVSFAPGPIDTGFPSPFTAVVTAGTALAPTSLGELIRATTTSGVGVVRATLPGVPGSCMELWATRALHRSRRHQGDRSLGDVARELFGELWLSSAEVGLHAATAAITPQGMIVQAATPTSPSED